MRTPPIDRVIGVAGPSAKSPNRRKYNVVNMDQRQEPPGSQQPPQTSTEQAVSEWERLRQELAQSHAREKTLQNIIDRQKHEIRKQRIIIGRGRRTASSSASRLRRLIEQERKQSEQIDELVKTNSVLTARLQIAMQSAQTSGAEVQRRIAVLEANASRLKSELAFQTSVQLLMQIGHTDAPHNATCRLQCRHTAPQPALSPQVGLFKDDILCSFGMYVSDAFSETRTFHRRNGQPTDLCPLPQYEVTGIDAVINPDLADRFRLYVQQARAREPTWDHCHVAHRVAKPPPSMRLLSLFNKALGWDETMLLGWHGASDEDVAGILADGFNPCCAGIGAGSLFGKGIYFAENSSKADLYAGPKERRFRRHKESMTVILSVVFCGNMHAAKTCCRGITKPPAPSQEDIGASGVKRWVIGPDSAARVHATPFEHTMCSPFAVLHPWLPPCLQYCADFSGARFHSVLGQKRSSGGVVDHPEYIVFDNAQALPIAAVTYRHAATCACCRCICV